MASLSETLSKTEWLSKDVARVQGLDLFFDPTLEGAPGPGQTLVLKPRSFLDVYAEVLGDAPTKRVIELGIWQGGSALAFAALLDVDRLVCLDINPPNAAFDAARAANPAVGDRIAPYYETSQDDEPALDRICRTEFGGAAIDLVIDDASHFYGLSKRSFEILFPRLKPGGWYVIEDWAWAHGLAPAWPDEPSLATLVFKLQLAWIARPNLISKVIVRPEMTFIQKGENAPNDAFDVDDLYILHNRSFPLIR